MKLDNTAKAKIIDGVVIPTLGLVPPIAIAATCAALYDDKSLCGKIAYPLVPLPTIASEIYYPAMEKLKLKKKQPVGKVEKVIHGITYPFSIAACFGMTFLFGDDFGEKSVREKIMQTLAAGAFGGLFSIGKFVTKGLFYEGDLNPRRGGRRVQKDIEEGNTPEASSDVSDITAMKSASMKNADGQQSADGGQQMDFAESVSDPETITVGQLWLAQAEAHRPGQRRSSAALTSEAVTDTVAQKGKGKNK